MSATYSAFTSLESPVKVPFTSARSLAVGLLLMLWATFTFAQDARDAQRIALLIGNSNYKSAPLANPVNDARAMAGVLKGLGFETIIRENVRTRELGSVYREFRSRIKPGAVALVFYAGHGVQVRGQNYFPSVDSEIGAEEDVPLQSLNLSTLLENMEEARAGLSVVLLDACRNNPYVRSFRSAVQGLSKVTAPSGTLIHYATKPGSVADDGRGQNSPYTQALLAHLGTPGIQIEIALKNVTNAVVTSTQGRQEPWVEGSLRGDFYLRPAQNQAASVGADPMANDRVFWETVRDSRKPNELAAYLDRFPNGLFADIARSRLSELRLPAPPANPLIIDAEDAFQRGQNFAKPGSLNRNDSEAVRLFRIASAQGHPGAQVALSEMYFYGKGGLRRDEIEAARLAKLSANQGDPLGQSRLGFLTSAGMAGIQKDEVEAVRLYKLSADQGNSSGQSNLGFMYYTGRGGLPKDEAEAIRLYKLSASQGNGGGQANLGWAYVNGRGGLPQDDLEAVRLFKMSAEQESPSGQAGLAIMYLQGRGQLQKNELEAVRLLKLSAENGSALGQANLAWMYLNGRGGLQKDETEAVQLFRLAAQRGNEWALSELKRLGKL